MGCRDPQGCIRTHTHTHTLVLLDPKYTGWTVLVSWAEMFRFNLFLRLYSFFLLHSFFTAGLFALLPLAPLWGWPGGERRLWWGGNGGCREAYLRSREAKPDYSDHSVAAENRAPGLPHRPSDFTLMTNSLLTTTVEVFYTSAVQYCASTRGNQTSSATSQHQRLILTD